MITTAIAISEVIFGLIWKLKKKPCSKFVSPDDGMTIAMYSAKIEIRHFEMRMKIKNLRPCLIIICFFAAQTDSSRSVSATFLHGIRCSNNRQIGGQWTRRETFVHRLCARSAWLLRHLQRSNFLGVVVSNR